MSPLGRVWGTTTIANLRIKELVSTYHKYNTFKQNQANLHTGNIIGGAECCRGYLLRSARSYYMQKGGGRHAAEK